MKVDMSKYFYTIDHKELKKKLFKFIKNEDSRYLINLIIDGYKAPDIYDHLFPKD
jgi:RNA-directed DNA polymerase